MSDTPTPRTDKWETYCDEWYYHLWRLRRKTERGFNDGFHINNGDEAKGLCDLLNKLERERDEAREQRDRLADAFRKIKKAGGNYTNPFDELDFIDGVTYEALQSLNPDHTVAANDMTAAVKGGADES